MFDPVTLQDALTGGRTVVALLALFQASLIEYVFPVFPGDTVTIAGAVLVVTSGLPAWGVFSATMAGGMAGSALDYWIGRAFGRADRNAGNNRLANHPSIRRLLHRAGGISSQIARRGTILLLLNRLMPGIRSLLFIAAGMADMPFWKAMLAGAVSNAVWTGLLMLAGMALGANLEKVIALFRTYTLAAWICITVAIAAWAILSFRRGAKQRRESRNRSVEP